MNTLHTTTVALLLAVAVGSAAASPDQHRYGKVLRAEPIYETVQVEVPEQRCWKEPVERAAYPEHRQLATTLVGGALGGLLGNQVGDGTGRTLMTVAGTMLGAALGHQVGAQLAGPDDTRPWTRHCTTVQHSEAREALVGYDVEYRYRGRIHRTRTDHHPGKRIRVDHALRPMHF